MGQVQHIDYAKERTHHLTLAQHFDVMGMTKRTNVHLKAAYIASIAETNTIFQRTYQKHLENNKIRGYAKTTS